jgi:lysophospholipase L1-like esterase
MTRLIRPAVFVALALIVVLVGAGLLLGGEAWLASRGQTPPDPPPGPEDLPIGAGGAGGIGGAGGAGGIGEGATPVPVVVWLGDSTAAGVGASGPASALPQQVAQLLGQPIRLTVLARSGARVADVLRLQLPRVAAVHPTEVFISVGANDATHLTSRPRFRRDYDRLVGGLPDSVTRVVLLGVPDLGGPRRLAQPLRAVAGWRGRALATDIRNLARRRRAIYVDIARGTGPAFRREPKRYFFSDRYHPNDAGYHLWATVVAAAVHGAPD